MNSLVSKLKNWWPLVLIGIVAGAIGAFKTVYSGATSAFCSVSSEACGVYEGDISDQGEPGGAYGGLSQDEISANSDFLRFLDEWSGQNVELMVSIQVGPGISRECYLDREQMEFNDDPSEGFCINGEWVEFQDGYGIRHLHAATGNGETLAASGEFYVKSAYNGSMGNYWSLEPPL